MRARRAIALAPLFAGLLFAAPQHAQDRSSGVVATVGSLKLPADTLRRRLAAMPAYQLRALGATPSEIRGRVLAEQLVPDLLYAAEAERIDLAKHPAVAARINDALRRSLEQQERTRLARDNPVTDEDVRRYFAANRARYESPRRLRLWRLLLDDEPLARRAIAEAHGAGGPARWRDLAREHSLDTATRMRSGDLGFVQADGRTDVPRVRVDPALFAAADTVNDGEIVPEPVREGAHFAVVWRRGSLAATSRTIDEEAPTIRRILMRARLRDSVDALVANLRRQHVSAVDESLLSHVRFPPPDFGQGRLPSPGPSASPAVSAPPVLGERGLR